ncbi:UDP-N-acetylmuramate dehydrogenase [Christiangramia forsetii]|uniref:UDP-N-acetylenolpyruvoylglucosamine reductase n=2 Tax=Christiangramia forsetii TaxID=411153 RepID=A0M5I2_CHRFK|nr:UDP-N-acetylmuramate dehydrogenase [Christiangramia forsetii]GGG32882.1 UDP-N-acetylenolpyruvoylglucosamine reductase [Christiangramia forsetii]CAL67877.1 UDP-N-acetylenolpyruvoylglucosamine reductase [Christiangramia forsetii KT0803]
MRVLRNFSLKGHNSFGIDVRADKFISIENVDDLRSLLRKSYASELFILGGGSNMLLTGDIHKTVVHIALNGKKIVSETDEEVIIEASAGENWHEFVLWTLEQNYGGLENLSLIPGNVGTAPIQNIGAYGVELKDSFVSCKAMNVQTLEEQTFSLEKCEFSYRNSVFKNQLKGQYIITSVRFRLTKENHQLNVDYGAIRSELEKNAITSPGIQDISNAVIAIRRSKLPDPKEIGNSGSFFKNPIISQDQFKELEEKFPEIPSYKISDNEIKVPAGWLIDQAGFKGYRKGDAGVHKNQALVLVNYGEATGAELLVLSKNIQKKIKDQFNIDLEAEVNII